ncbi:MAG: hypothetical protein EOP09_06945, partial [Proteobacteria bacterium]
MQASFKTYFRFFGILSVFQTFAFAALAAPTFGAEFNFTNFEVRHGQAQASDVNSEVSESYRDAFMLEVMKVCGDCKVVTTENSYGVKTYKIVYPDKWYFVIATDPAVIEVQTKPSTAKQIENRLERIQKHIFDAAKAVGLDPASKVMGTEWAGSHIHVGATSALGEGREAVLALRNFMVDFSNHPELATGVFTNDHSNAPPIAELPVMQRELFKAVIA